MSIDEMKAAFLRMPAESRAIFLREMLAMLDAPEGAHLEQLWIAEATKREQEAQCDASCLGTLQEVLDRADKRVK